jgi:hypothetical protein
MFLLRFSCFVPEKEEEYNPLDDCSTEILRLSLVRFRRVEALSRRVLSDIALERARKRRLRIEVLRGPFDSEDEADKRQELSWEAMMDDGED